MHKLCLQEHNLGDENESPHAIFCSTSCALLYCTFDRGNRSTNAVGVIDRKSIECGGPQLDSPLEAHDISCSHDVLADDGTVIDVKCASISNSLVEDGVVSVSTISD